MAQGQRETACPVLAWRRLGSMGRASPLFLALSDMSRRGSQAVSTLPASPARNHAPAAPKPTLPSNGLLQLPCKVLPFMAGATEVLETMLVSRSCWAL